jgi:hypothetical protein
MSTAMMTERITVESPRFKAKAAGVCWLMTILVGTLALLWSPIVANLIAGAFYVGAALFVYQLLRAVNRSLSLLSASFGIVGYVVGSLYSLFDFGPAGAEFIFFGLHCSSIGYLILRSTFLPRAVGVLMVSSGLAWLTFSSSNLLLSPEIAGSLSPYAMGLGILGEVILTLWLLVVGVNEQRWMEQAGAPGR